MRTIDRPVYSYEISGLIKDGGILHLTEKFNGEVRKSVMDLKEKFIREALIELGWTPPLEKQ